MPEAAAALELRDSNIQFEPQAIDISKLNLQNELQSAA